MGVDRAEAWASFTYLDLLINGISAEESHAWHVVDVLEVGIHVLHNDVLAE